MAKITDADIMQGFNPQFGLTAEQIEAQQGDAVPSGDAPEGEGETPTEGTETPATTAVAEEREVMLDGRAYKAPRDIADAFTREINRRDGTRGAELHTLRERLARLEVATTKPAEAVEDKSPKVPDPEMQIENPAEYQKQLVEYITYHQEQRVSALAQQTQEADASRQREVDRVNAWNNHVDRFYAQPDNAVLRENRDIVDLVLEQNRERLAPLSVDDGFKELSKLAKERLARVTGQAPELKARTTPRPPVLEGSSRRDSAVRPVAVKDEGPRSLTQAIKERRRAAKESFSKGGTPRTAAAR